MNKKSVKNSAAQMVNVNPDVKVKNIEPTNDKGRYKCTCCGKEYTTQKGHFPISNSVLYKGNNGFLPICRECVEKYYEQMVAFYSGNEEHAMEHCCHLFDWYYCTEAMAMTRTVPVGGRRIACYPSKMNMVQIQKKGTTYLDTVKDKHSNNKILTESDAVNAAQEDDVTQAVSLDTIKFFGYGYSTEDYQFLEEQYADWTSRYECKTKAQEELYKSLCFAQLNMQQAQRRGDNKSVNEAFRTLQDLMGTANIKPNQTNNNALIDQNCFGTFIKKVEDERPIAKPDPEWEDVDNIENYIETFFLGHLCNLVHVKNDYEDKYRAEMAKYTVAPPTYEEDEAGETSLLDRYSNKGEKDDNS